MAEAMATREAILLAWRKGWSSIIIEGDCASVVDKLQSPVSDLSVVGPIIRDIH